MAKKSAAATNGAGPKLAELDNLTSRSKWLQTHATILHGGGEKVLDIYWNPTATVSVGAEMLAFAGQFPGATIQAGLITHKASGFPLSRKQLEELLIAAWHEAFGVAVPPAQSIKLKKQEVRTKLTDERAQWLAVLREKGGIQKWNANHDALRKLKVSLAKVDLSGCNLEGIHLYVLDAKEVNLQGANLEQADMHGCKFTQANLAGACCKSVFFRAAPMTSANLSGADFTKARLRGVNLKKAICTGGNFTGADFTGSDLCGADFTNAILAQTVWTGAKFDETTKFPKGFKPTLDMKWQGAGQSPALVQQVAKLKAKKPLDSDAFMKRLEAGVESAKLEKALAMLKADRFKLYAQVTDDRLVGIVKSQGDPDLVYSCKLAADGTYGCCTQNLNICGGLRGSLCKHLLVLIVGLTKAGDLDPNRIDTWVLSSKGQKPVLDKDAMSETFLRYKGAEAGEVDWRPTETIPEDYYAM